MKTKVLFETGCGKYFGGYTSDNQLWFTSNRAGAYEFPEWISKETVFTLMPSLEIYKRTFEFLETEYAS